jgi:hypothetical protein
MISPRRILVSCLVLFLAASLGLAQVRTTGEIRGKVLDPTGALVPGATVTAKDLATNITQTATTGENGAFVLLNLQSGAYEVTASKEGFRTVVLSNIVVETARTLDLNIQMAVGQVTTTIEVKDAAPLLETTTNTVSTTIRNDFVQDLPLAGRDTLQFAALTAGAQSPGQGTRNSTFNGLPNASLQITLDGINNNSQRFKTGGTSFFAFAPIRLDAIEEVTVATTGSGADASAGAAMTMRFTTRRGTNQWRGRVFEQFENDALNANTFFGNARGQRRSKVRRNDFGGRIGGPLPLPFTQNKLYMFVNFEAAPRPNTANQTAGVLTQEAQQGNFTYRIADGSLRTVNVLQVAGAAGFPNQVDPTVRGILNEINATIPKGTGLIPNTANPNQQTLQWVSPRKSTTLYPTARLDYQLNPKMAWHGTWNLRWQHNLGWPAYPEAAVKGDAYKITTYVASNAFDWSISPTILNTFNFGVQSNVELFYEDTSIRQWAPYGNRRLNLGSGVNPIIRDQVPWIRNNPVYNLYDNVNWVKGRHTFTFGGSYLNTSFYETTWNNAGVLNYNLGIASGDPITSALGAAQFPGIATTDLTGARNLYATLTGRISSITGSRNVDEISHKYEDFAPITNRQAFATGGIYFQDSFRWTPNLTLNFGLRWEFSGAMHNTNNIVTPPDLANFFGPSTGLFAPGVLNGVANPQLTLRPYTYSGDKINPAPNFGFAWNPKFDSGALGKLLGSKTVFRGSYGINYYDEGLNTFSNRVFGNPGTTQSISLQPGMPGFSPGGLRLSSTIPAPSVNPAAFQFPMNQSLFTFAAGLATSNPVMRTPYVQNWNFSIQRELGRGMVFEARYVGNKGTHIWHAYSLNETNIFENGFLQEFRSAQNNLAINQANGRGNTFANNGLPGQVALPIFGAAFGARGSQGALASGSAYTNGTFVDQLTLGNVGTMANTLATNNIYFCRLVGSSFSPCGALGYNAAGPYPINFFRPNPFVTGLTLFDDASYSTYHGLQLEFRKALSHGLTLNANYTWSKALSDLFNLNDQAAIDNYRTLRNKNLDKGPSAFDLRHVFISYWTYDLPFGKGRRFLNSSGWMDRVFGGWQLSGIHRFNSGQVYQLTGNRTTFASQTDSGVILNGISVGQLQDMLRSFRPGPNLNAAADPRLTGPDGRANSSLLSVVSTPGQFGQFLYLYNTPLVINDMALLKTIPITERIRFTFQVETLNTFNHPVLNVGTTTIDSTSFGQTTGTRVDPRNIQLRARIDF